MVVEFISGLFTVYKLKYMPDTSEFDLFFLSKTDREISLVVKSEIHINNIISQEDGWQLIRIAEDLDFDQVGIIAKLSAIFKDISVSIFTISTYNTDYILFKKIYLDKVIMALSKEYSIKGIPSFKI